MPPVHSQVLLKAAPEPPERSKLLLKHTLEPSVHSKVMLKRAPEPPVRSTVMLKRDPDPQVHPKVMLYHTPEPPVPVQTLFTRMLAQACRGTTSALTQKCCTSTI